MPLIVIDGVRLEAKPGKTIIEAAYENGMQITHFCWHPELSVSGNCRMCLVEVGMPRRQPDGTTAIAADGSPEINYFPKLQIACATQIAEGMHVKTKSDKALKAQEAVMEFLLINHPLDCPICDEAGQCKLQEYAFKHSAGESRFIETKNHKPKRQIWGPNVIFDAERCISCSRCIRFSKEVAKQDVLTFVQRGDHVTIKLFDGFQLDNNYSMNVIDICPVGALTSRDFRFKSRVWEMSFNDSICTGCARGCNIKLGVRNNEILRVEPRSNMYVNTFWMCDYGRLSQYSKVNRNRVLEPMHREEGSLKPVQWRSALETAASILKSHKPGEIMTIGSPRCSTEDNFLLHRFTKTILKSQNIDLMTYFDENFADDFLRVKDKSPNYLGAREVGLLPSSAGIDSAELLNELQSGSISVLLVMDEDFANYPAILSALDESVEIIAISSNHSALTEKAKVIFPASTFAESEGTFVNVNRRVQRFEPALVTKENLRTMGMKMSRWDKFGAPNDRWSQHEQRGCRQSWRIIQLLANMFGAGWNYIRSEDVFKEISKQFPAFKGMSYMLLDEFRGLTLGKAENPDPKINEYVSYYMKPE